MTDTQPNEPVAWPDNDPRHEIDVDYEIWQGSDLQASSNSLTEARRYEAQYQPCSLLMATTYRQPVDAPLASHPAPEQVAEAQDAAVGGLLERLGRHQFRNETAPYVNPDGPEAASVIRSLRAERDALKEYTAKAADHLMKQAGELVSAEAERDALAEHVALLEDEDVKSSALMKQEGDLIAAEARAESAEAESNALLASILAQIETADDPEHHTLGLIKHMILQRAALAMQGEGS